MNKKTIAMPQSKNILSEFNRMVSLNDKYKWLTQLRKDISNHTPWDCIDFVISEGVINNAGASQVAVYMYNRQTERLKMIKLCGRVKLSELHKKSKEIYKCRKITDDSFHVYYDVNDLRNSEFAKPSIIPREGYEWLNRIVENGPFQVYKDSGDNNYFLVFKYPIDNNSEMIIKVNKEEFFTAAVDELQEFSLLCKAMFSQVRNRLLADRILFNSQVLKQVDLSILPEKGVSVSLLGVDEAIIKEKIEKYKDIVHSFHIDVMDGHFVQAYQVFDIHGQNIDVNDFPFMTQHLIRKIKEEYDVPLDVHLMVRDPEQYIIEYAIAGADVITISFDPNRHKLKKYLGLISSLGKISGVAISPDTPIKSIEDIIEETDLILVMTVPPGKGGQKFDPYMLEKIERLRALIEQKGLKTIIQVDGGINEITGPQTINAGANFLVAGSALIKSDTPKETVERILGAQLP
ncbi:MAG: hypothetical protein DKM50_08260 [Candidatus Margulisiibacteriota bacterium]|nr:MAG: hypothetical protein DKM50_08260 [Candidatus Margulisiibacteriota bacterium]HAR63230.1 hypothetical protein [Candidatus Margulisiibacteriota bacterium]HCY35618.1 hypothetical protein [Candidatus Margulisiibacteriota bacterium]